MGYRIRDHHAIWHKSHFCMSTHTHTWRHCIYVCMCVCNPTHICTAFLLSYILFAWCYWSLSSLSQRFDYCALWSSSGAFSIQVILFYFYAIIYLFIYSGNKRVDKSTIKAVHISRHWNPWHRLESNYMQIHHQQMVRVMDGSHKTNSKKYTPTQPLEDGLQEIEE